MFGSGARAALNLDLLPFGLRTTGRSNLTSGLLLVSVAFQPRQVLNVLRKVWQRLHRARPLACHQAVAKDDLIQQIRRELGTCCGALHGGLMAAPPRSWAASDVKPP